MWTPPRAERRDEKRERKTCQIYIHTRIMMLLSSCNFQFPKAFYATLIETYTNYRRANAIAFNRISLINVSNTKLNFSPSCFPFYTNCQNRKQKEALLCVCNASTFNSFHCHRVIRERKTRGESGEKKIIFFFLQPALWKGITIQIN